MIENVKRCRSEVTRRIATPIIDGIIAALLLSMLGIPTAYLLLTKRRKVVTTRRN